jgi:hypothetical protein
MFRHSGDLRRSCAPSSNRKQVNDGHGSLSIGLRGRRSSALLLCTFCLLLFLKLLQIIEDTQNSKLASLSIIADMDLAQRLRASPSSSIPFILT